ncbi:MAG: helix-turn-helix domain-containing protein [Clostridia bacterium]|nr:helix-turn-helix domain-containing protein [Clostridia bacterium]
MSFIEIERSVRAEEWSMNDLHSHSHFEIYYLTKGSRTFLLSNALYKLDAPIVVIIPPHVMHKTEGGAFERYNINVSDSYLDEFQRHIFKENSLKIIRPTKKAHEEMTKIFETLQGVDRRQKYGEQKIKTLFSYAIYLLSENLGNEQFSPAAADESDMPPTILKVIDYLNNHFSDRITLDDLAAEFFLSKGTLVYNFNKYAHCSPIDFLLTVRLTKAKEMLLKTKKSVNEIAELCGFSSANYFGLIFKRKENLSPANYRKHQREKG